MKGEKRLNVRLSDAEYEALVERAKTSGLTISHFVRRRCLGKDDRPRIVVDVDILKALYRDQKRIGGLLNQLLRHANTRPQDFPLLVEQAQKTLAQLYGTSEEISELIADARASA